jgi:hypothetical protein
MRVSRPAAAGLAVLGIVIVLAAGPLSASLRGSAARPAPHAALAAPKGVRTVFPEDRLPVLARADGSSRAVKSLLNVPERMTYGQFVWDDKAVPAGEIWVRVDLGRQMLSVFRGGHEIGTSVILYGADEKRTPGGDFPILAKSKNHRSSTYDAAMPYTLRLTPDGVAIHGSDVREGAATHGCIGVPLAFAEHLFASAAKGDVVTILS